MVKMLIEQKVVIGRRYLRAVDMKRDLLDSDALNGYILTPSVRDGFERVVRGLRRGSTQRAFRVTGPYGCGKSSFGLFLARSFMGDEGDETAERMLRYDTDSSDVPRFLPLILVGRRASLADDILRALIETAGSSAGTDRTTVNKAKKVRKMRENGQRDVQIVLDLLSSYAGRLHKRTGFGLLLLIDEMGRYLEFVAANPNEEDPSIFQLLAELAGGSETVSLSVIGFLHHRFGDYVAGMGDWVEGEWAKSSERYEEIAFYESTEQTLHLIAEALNHVGQQSSQVRKSAHSLYSEACSRRMFATSDSNVLKLTKNLYPIHPAALSCLATISRRFGQNERSVFSFLQSLEPGGFGRFVSCSEYDAGTWYRLNELFDYLSAQGSFRFRSSERERRWVLAVDTVIMCADMDPMCVSVIKVVGLMSVLEPIPGLKSDPSCIGWCLGVDENSIKDALEDLTGRGLVHKRSSRGDYSLWSHSSVDLERWLEDAKAAVPVGNWLESELQELPPARPVVAQRHYQRTGMLRTFASIIGKKPIAPTGDTDGTILLIAVHPQENLVQATENAKKISWEDGPLVIIRQYCFTPADVVRARELACWRWIRSNCQELRIDDVARIEVNRRIADLETELLRAMASFSNPGKRPEQETWLWNGREISVSSKSELNRLISRICDEVFVDAPILKNELINRHKLSTAIAAARTRLFQLMVENESDENLGMEGAPPERTIFLSLFRASGMHRSVDGRFGFNSPSHDDPQNWMPAWKLIDDLAHGEQAIGVNELLVELARPPIGLRTGPALLVVAAYIISQSREVAVLEKNSFQPLVSKAHFVRMAKNPKNFALRHVSSERGGALLERLSGRLSIWNGSPPDPELKSVVEALYRWWLTVSAYAQSTQVIAERTRAVRTALIKGREPIQLILEELPKACGLSLEEEEQIDEYVTALDMALTEIAEALPLLRKRTERVLLHAFAGNSVAEVREQIGTDYKPHILELGEYRLRAFVDRAVKSDTPDEIWIDSIASLVTGRRLESWDDDKIYIFEYEIHALAQMLVRRLALIRESKEQDSPLTAIFVTPADGNEQSIYVRTNGKDLAQSSEAEQMRQLLRQIDQPDALLVELLSEHIELTQAKDAAR